MRIIGKFCFLRAVLTLSIQAYERADFPAVSALLYGGDAPSANRRKPNLFLGQLVALLLANNVLGSQISEFGHLLLSCPQIFDENETTSAP